MSAYDKAKRSFGVKSQTGPNVGPNTYKVVKNVDWREKAIPCAPFLTRDKRFRAAKVSDSPGPAYNTSGSHGKIIGGASMLFTEPRFRKLQFPGPAPGDYDPYRYADDLIEIPLDKPRLKGYLYHCNVPYTLLGYMPTIPNLRHQGYKILKNKTMTECCVTTRDDSPSPLAYDVKFGHGGEFYRGCFWSRHTSKRKFGFVTDSPGPAAYSFEASPNPLREHLNLLRQEREKKESNIRYLDKVRHQALRNCYPAPNEYSIRFPVKCVRQKKKLVPKKLVRSPKVLPDRTQETPGPNAYMDPRTALEYLKKPSCLPKFSAFLTNAIRFSQYDQGTPAPNAYCPSTFLEELARKVSPYAVRRTAFDSSVPEKPPPPEPREPEPCPKPPPPPPKLRPCYPFNSTFDRLKTQKPCYCASAGSYSITPAFKFITDQVFFNHAPKYNFGATEPRFKIPRTFGQTEDKSYSPAPKYMTAMALDKHGVSFHKVPRFQERHEQLPSLLKYNTARNLLRQTFNVTLKKHTMRTQFEQYRMRLKHPKILKLAGKTKTLSTDRRVCGPVSAVVNISEPRDFHLRHSRKSTY